MESSYTKGLQGNAKTRYLEKLQLLNGVDPFLLAGTAGTGGNDSAPTQYLPPVEATDLVSFLVLETSFVTAKQSQANSAAKKYCYCQDSENDGDEMIACDYSHCAIEWFHTRCLKITTIPSGRWYCPTCRKLLECKRRKKK